MMARSTTCSNQRPDTLMQDRICQVDETSCNARPDHTSGSKAPFDRWPMTSGLPSTTDLGEMRKRVRFVPNSEVAFSFDHLVRAEEERGGNLDTQGPRCRR